MRVIIIDKDLGLPTDQPYDVLEEKKAYKLHINGDDVLIWSDMVEELNE